MVRYLLPGVFGDSVESENALVFEGPLVSGNPGASGNLEVSGNPLLSENSLVCGNSLVSVTALEWPPAYVNNYEHATDSFLVLQARLVMSVLDSIAFVTPHDVV